MRTCERASGCPTSVCLVFQSTYKSNMSEDLQPRKALGTNGRVRLEDVGQSFTVAVSTRLGLSDTATGALPASSRLRGHTGSHGPLPLCRGLGCKTENKQTKEKIQTFLKI